jgi:hypothetical protein
VEEEEEGDELAICWPIAGMVAATVTPAPTKRMKLRRDTAELSCSWFICKSPLGEAFKLSESAVSNFRSLRHSACLGCEKPKTQRLNLNWSQSSKTKFNLAEHQFWIENLRSINLSKHVQTMPRNTSVRTDLLEQWIAGQGL